MDFFYRQINVSFSVDLVTRVSGIEGKIGRIGECVTVSRPQLPVIFKCNLISQTLFFFSSFLAEFCQRLSGKVFCVVRLMVICELRRRES